jgi:hypothetical protein
MAEFDGTVRIDSKLDSRGLNTGIAGISSSLMKMAGAIGIAFSLSAVIRWGKQAIKLASDLDIMKTRFNTIFGSMAATVQKQMQDLATATNFDVDDLMSFAVQLQNTFLGMGYAGDAASDMSTRIVKLAEDISLFYQKDTAAVVGSLQYAMMGYTRGLREYGIVINDTLIKEKARTMGLWNGTGALEAQAKAQAILEIVTEKTASAAGTAISTMGTWASQIRGISVLWEDFAEIMGAGFMAMLQGLLPVITWFLNILTRVATTFYQLMSILFGMRIQLPGVSDGLGEAATGAGDLADNTEAAGKAAKGALAAFDELNVLQQAEGGAGAGMPITSPSTLPIITPDFIQMEGFIAKSIAGWKEFGTFLEILWDNVSKWVSDGTTSFGEFYTVAAAGLTSWAAKTVTGFQTWAATTVTGLQTWASNTVTNFQAWTSTTAVGFDGWVAKSKAGFVIWADDTVKGFNTWSDDTKVGFQEWATTTKSGFTAWCATTVAGFQDWAAGKITFEQWIDETVTGFQTWALTSAIGFQEWAATTVTGFQGWAATTTTEFQIWAAITVTGFQGWVATTVTGFQGWAAATVTEFQTWSATTTTGFINWFWTTFDGFNTWMGSTILAFHKWAQDILMEINTFLVKMIPGLGGIETAWVDLFDNMEFFVVGTVNRILNTIETMLNGVVDGINAVIALYNTIPNVDQVSPVERVILPRVSSRTRYTPLKAPVPWLATGAVIPPNAAFAAVLGDQKSGRNIEAPEGLIRQIVREETRRMDQQPIMINFAGSLAALVRELKPYLDKENRRVGISFIESSAA